MSAQNTLAPEGVLILDKPDGMTSHDCVAIMRRLFHTKKVGHTGTLDPMATGVLPILIGRAAKAAEYLTAEEVGRYLGIHPVTVRRLARTGQLPAKRYGKLWRFDPAVIRIEKERKEESAT